MIGSLDHDKSATISWLNPLMWGERPDTSLEECWDQLTLKEAVTFAIEHLDAKYRKSVIIKCGADKFNVFEIEQIYHSLDHSRKQAAG